MPQTEAAEVADVLRSYGLNDDTAATVVNAIRADKRRWVDFMMRFELGLEEPDPRRARRSALTIALSYVAGGLVPLAPYFFLRSVHYALVGSVIVTLLALLVFGYVKGRFTTARPFRSAWQTVILSPKEKRCVEQAVWRNRQGETSNGISTYHEADRADCRATQGNRAAAQGNA
jgi:vacuolar iron transporter family protein